MNVGEMMTLRGDLKIFVRELDGTLVEEREVQNLIVNGGKTLVAKLLGGDASYKNIEHITKIAFGTSSTAAAAANTALGAEQYEKAVAVSYPAYNKVMFTTTMEGNEGGSFTYQELGLKSDATEILFSRVIITPITKSTLYKITVEWTISIQ
jgi:hypothetical protein